MEKYLLLSERAKYEIKNFMPLEKDVLKLALYFQNFSDSTRIKILSCLSFCDLCVNDLSTLLKTNQTTISHQLKLLKQQGLVSFHREGKILIYSLTTKNLDDIFSYAIKNINA